MVRSEITKALQRAVSQESIQVSKSENESFGDYSTNVAMRLKLDPKEIAERLLADKELAKVVGRVEVATPGFINFWVHEDYLKSELLKVRELGEKYGFSNKGKGKTIIVEYSSPNIAKRFGIGHLRSTIIGQALYNLYKAQGYKVVGENHLGDWGTQFGVVLYQLSGLSYKELTVEELEELYVDFNRKVEDDPKLWEQAKLWFKKLEDGDPEARKIWDYVKEVSMSEFERIYNLLGVKIDNAHGESFYEDKMPAIIEEIRKKGLSTKSKGAEIVEFKGMPPAMLLKSDGTTTYFTRDLAAIEYRIATWKPEKIIYEVGVDQKLHFSQVFAAAKLLGIETKLVHVAHGLIRYEHGKMSTRRGKTVNLEEILEEAISRAKKFNSDTEVARAVGIGAIIYFDLMHSPATDIIFDWEKIFILEGNSGPYLQYTYARAQSVLAKAEASGKKVTKSWDAKEIGLMRKLIKFGEIIEDAATSYSPNILANYLYELAQTFNNFYNSNRIIGSENEAVRLELTHASGQILANGLKLLGIPAPRKM